MRIASASPAPVASTYVPSAPPPPALRRPRMHAFENARECSRIAACPDARDFLPVMARPKQRSEHAETFFYGGVIFGPVTFGQPFFAPCAALLGVEEGLHGCAMRPVHRVRMSPYAALDGPLRFQVGSF